MTTPIKVARLQRSMGRLIAAKRAAVTGATLAAAFAIPLCSTAAHAGYTLLNISGFSEVPGEPDYSSSYFSGSAQSLDHGVQLSGQFGPITGSAYVGNLTWVALHGAFDDVVAEGGVFHTAGELTFTFTGGSVTFNQIVTLIDPDGDAGGADVYSVATTGVPIPFAYDDEPSSQEVVSGTYQVSFGFTWTGFSPTDTLSVATPPNGIVLTNTSPLPEPTTVAMLLPLGAVCLRRRGR
jgi:hypothetical protein